MYSREVSYIRCSASGGVYENKELLDFENSSHYKLSADRIKPTPCRSLEVASRGSRDFPRLI